MFRRLLIGFACGICAVAHSQNYVHDPFTQVKQNGEFAVFPFAGGLNNPQFWALDLNRDGIDDLLVFDRTGDKALTFINNGTPGVTDYVYAPVFEGLFPPMQNFVVMNDVNCDGVGDIFTSYDNGIKVYYSVLSGSTLSYVEQIDKMKYNSAGTDFDIFVGVIDIPAVVDVNMDGDPDILNFRPAGGFVDYFENRQIETGQPCGTFSLELITSCWGNFYESGIDKSVTLDTLCSELHGGRSGLHAGSTFLAYDADLDNDIDIVLGDLSFNNLNALTNGGDAEYAIITGQDTTFPLYDLPVNLPTFPAPFLIDVDNDTKKDMIVAPNKKGYSENFKNVWFYKNEAADGAYLFTFQSDSFLVSDMIDVGEGAHPAFFDYNQDGLIDIVIGNYGYFASGDFTSSLALYENTGAVDSPAFTLITRDFAGLSAYDFINIQPAFYDMDNDGNTDMVIGEQTGALHYFRNIAPAGGSADFVLQEAFYKGIDVGIASAPFVMDITNDSLPDLIIGEQNGNLNYYENTGSPGMPAFTLISEFWGNVDVRTPGLLTGHSTPFLFRDGASWKLLVGSESGTIYYYQPTADWSGAFTLITGSFSGIDEGEYANVDFRDIDNDGIPELLTGNYKGGISLYKEESTLDAVAEIHTPQVIVYPNPVKHTLGIASSHSIAAVSVISVSGAVIQTMLPRSTRVDLNLESVKPGLYLLVVTLDNGVREVHKIMKL